MLRVSRVAQLLVALLGTLVFLGRPALAQPARPQGVYVLEIDSDDADDQAEALTGALRSRVRAAPEWLLLDATQSLSMLTAALRCPQHPDAACLQRIGDHLKADRLIWGILSKQASPHFVTADMHLWTRGQPDVSVKESYTDNLKDQNDDALRKIANRIFDRLTGGPASNITLHAGTADGVVIVDGEHRVTLQHGSATLVLRSGAHTIEVRATGFLPMHQNLTVTGGENQDVDVALVSEPPPPPPPSPSRSPQQISRARAEWGTLISGGILLVTGSALAIVFEAERSTLNADRSNNYGFENSIPTITNPCSVPNADNSSQVSGGCTAHNVAQAVLIPEIASLAAGGILATVGVVLLATDHRKETPPQNTETGFSNLKITPGVGPQGASLGLSGSF
jgi:hypothetical protein